MIQHYKGQQKNVNKKRCLEDKLLEFLMKILKLAYRSEFLRRRNL